MTQHLKLLSYIQVLPLRLITSGLRSFPLRKRADIGAFVGKSLVSLVPRFKNRVESNLKLIYPDMTSSERKTLRKAIGSNIGRTMAESFSPEDFHKTVDQMQITGPGLASLLEAREKGRGVMMVSGHFGQWEAGRAWLKANGMETGGIYRPHSNPYFEHDFSTSLKMHGEPIIPRTKLALRHIIKHVSSGGFFAILPDQKYFGAPILDFMGQPAYTATAAAEVALRLKVDLIPIYCVRDQKNLDDITIHVEAPIPHTDTLTMMQAVNDSLAGFIHKHPEQWLWIHRRWHLKKEDQHKLQNQDA